MMRNDALGALFRGMQMVDGSKVLKALKTSIQDFSTLAPGDLIGRLRDPDLLKKMKKLGVNDAQVHRMILILQEQKPDSSEFAAYLKSKFV